jgi:hypothetical protein
LTATLLKPDPTVMVATTVFEEPSMTEVAFKLGSATYTMLVFGFRLIADGLALNGMLAMTVLEKLSTTEIMLES